MEDRIYLETEAAKRCPPCPLTSTDAFMQSEGRFFKCPSSFAVHIITVYKDSPQSYRGEPLPFESSLHSQFLWPQNCTCQRKAGPVQGKIYKQGYKKIIGGGWLTPVPDSMRGKGLNSVAPDFQ